MLEEIKVTITTYNPHSCIVIDLAVDEGTRLQSVADRFFDLLGADEISIGTGEHTFHFMSEKEFLHRLEEKFPHLKDD